MEWSKKRASPRFDLAGSNVLACTLDDLDGAREAIALTGHNDNGYEPLVEAIARRYGISAAQVVTANGTSGANFQVCAALLEAGDDVLVEQPGYDPLCGAPRLLGANIVRFERRFEDGFRLDPDRVAEAITPRTRLVIVTGPHNPSGAFADRAALAEIGRIAASAGAHVLVDEVYLDVAGAVIEPAAMLGDTFVSTSSLTKSYGLSSLRCGWAISSPALAEKIRRARDVIDGTGSIVSERLSTLAFSQLDKLAARTAALLAANRALVDDFLRRHPELETVPSSGTVVFPRLRGVADTSRFAERLFVERETAIVPGRFFQAPAHFRIGFGGKTGALQGGLAAVSAALEAKEFDRAGG
jgi:aspartate/methionine/tyrosine aminotransferase